MRETEAGMFVRSLAGHDKGKYYLVLKTEKDFLYLTDGKYHPTSRPKKKNRKHIQPIHEISEAYCASMASGEPLRDEIIRKLIRDKENEEV